MTSMIPIKKAFKLLGGEEKYQTTSQLFNVRLRTLIKKGIIKGDLDDQVVNLESLKEHFTFESNVIENYLSIKEFHKALGLTSELSLPIYRAMFERLGENSLFEYVELDYPINLQKLYISKSSLENFLKAYISMDEVKSKVSRSDGAWFNTYKRFEISPFEIGRKRFIKKSEFKLILQEADASINESDYYSIKEYERILSIDLEKYRTIIEKDYNLNPRKVNGYKFYKKEVVDGLKLRQDDLREKYISLQEMIELAAAENFYFQEDNIESKPVDSLLRPFFKRKACMYSKEAFNNWLEERRKKSEFYSVSMESDFNTFKYRLKIKEININKLGPFTSETWLQFISTRLRISKASPQTIDSSINGYVSCTEKLINLVSSTRKKEIYSVTSNDINILFNEITKKDSFIIYLYLKQVYNQLVAKKMKPFDLNRVNDPFKSKPASLDKSIYEYEVYKKVYNYAKDISLHKERAIKDTLNEISRGGGKGQVKYYATSWLYVLLHLNNAWRHSDVITFPQVNLSGTQISDLNWMLQNELSDEDADYIIRQVYRAELIISKTQVKNYFFCSEELKKPFATAIAICQLRINALYPFRESIMDFGHKKQNFSESRRRNFFELYDDKEFYFSSRKMNRSLLSYIYILLSKMQKGTAGLKTIQKMRGHLEKETTNIYVDIPEEELNFLTRQLFARGSFGFVYDTFLDVLQGNEIDREKRTSQIQYLRNYFGDVYKIEEISGFLNVIQSDRKAILDRILSMGLEEALEFVNKIETNQLPSKQENVQCMVAEGGCIKKGQGISCFDCAFSIPNYYALSALGASLQDRLNSFLDSQKLDPEKPYYQQRKRARLFYIQLDLFAQAIQKFGFDVYEFITDSREEFNAHLNEIGSLNDLYQLT